MRKLFVTTLALSFLGALAIGVVYAWEETNTLPGTAPVGGAIHTVRLEPYMSEGLPVFLGPNGHEARPLKGTIDNKGVFPLLIASGAVAIDQVDPYVFGSASPDTSPGLQCAVGDFSGRVGVTNAGPVPVGAVAGGGFDVYVTVAPNAPADCQWDWVSMTVSITASTVPAPAP